MSHGDGDDGVGKPNSGPNLTARSKAAATARRDRMAKELRANLSKRKHQRRQREDGHSPPSATTDD